MEVLSIVRTVVIELRHPLTNLVNGKVLKLMLNLPS